MSKELDIIKDEYRIKFEELTEKEAILELSENDVTTPLGLEDRVLYLHQYVYDLKELITKMEEA